MSQMSRWDQQFYQVENHVAELMGRASTNPDPVASTVTIKDRDLIDQALARISVSHDKVSQSARRTLSQRRSFQTIGWWSKQLASKIKIVASEYVALQNRKMWLRLLQARFADARGGKSLDLQAAHLVDLAMRKKQLAELEAGFRHEMEFVAREREELTNEYQSLQIADQNWSASGSFQSRLGVNLSHARENPSARALSECLNILSVPANHPEEERLLRKVNQDLKAQSTRLAEQCLDLASSLAMGAGSADKISTNLFKETMDQVIALNDQVVSRFAVLRKRHVGRARPKLVQNTEKGDKTLAHP